MMIDSGLPSRYFADLITSHRALVDVVKFGWGTSVVIDDLKYKIDVLGEADVDFYFGGTLFERFVMDGEFDEWRRFCERFGCRTVEVSNGTIAMDNATKADYVRRLSPDFRVYSEVGFKDPVRSEDLSCGEWVSCIEQDLDAGAYRVIAEARESGQSGICHASGELRDDIVDEIAGSGIDIDLLMFEAPKKDLQTIFIRRFGSDVNLGNIAPWDLVPLETLRLGLRGDTMLDGGLDGGTPRA